MASDTSGDITTISRLAQRLAGCAADIRRRVNAALAVETGTGPLKRLAAAFRQALVRDLTDDGFADMYAQTVACGLLTARLSWPSEWLADDDAALMVPVATPFLRELMETFLRIGRNHAPARSGRDFSGLGIADLFDLLRRADTEAVLRDFADRHPHEDPVIRFYEDFLKEYDAAQRMKRGVFYTPRPVVAYIVRSVHELLQSEFGLEDGLADTATWGEMAACTAPRPGGIQIPDDVSPDEPFVRVLDPAAGTGTFLVEVIDVVHRTLAGKWTRAGLSAAERRTRWDEYVPRHLLPRLYGYELLTAPCAIAHMKIGLKLRETGFGAWERLDATRDRVHVYLTNALEPPLGSSDRSDCGVPALAHEAQAVNEAKLRRRFTVVLGNPPYARLSSNMSPTARRLVDPYKLVDGQPLNERKLWVQDDYVKFVRLAQAAIDQAGAGVLGYLTNHGYLDNPTLRGMRQSLMETFDRVRVLDLHGNAVRGETPPGGVADRNVFDIRQGVAVCLAARVGTSGDPSVVEHADLWGGRESKYGRLLAHDSGAPVFTAIVPQPPDYLFAPRVVAHRAEYERGWRLTDIMPVSCAGFITARDRFVMDFSPDVLLSRIAEFADPSLTERDIREKYFAGCGSDKYPEGDTRGWKLGRARRQVRDDRDWRTRAKQCLYRPFDRRWVYWADWMVDWPRPELTRHVGIDGNVFLQTCRQTVGGTWQHVLATRHLTEFCGVSNRTREAGYLFPLYCASAGVGASSSRRASEVNFAPGFRRALCRSLSIPVEGTGLPREVAARDVFGYIYAVLHSPVYRSRYCEFLKRDFPRIPLPGGKEVFRELAALGGELISLHLLESSKLDRPITRFVGRDRRLGRRIGGRGKTLEHVEDGLGRVSVNETSCFDGVSEEVWEFHVGGYQVCHKWLDERRKAGRSLSDDDVAHYQRIITALNGTVRLMAGIDRVIGRHGGWPDAFALQPTERTSASHSSSRPNS